MERKLASRVSASLGMCVCFFFGGVFCVCVCWLFFFCCFVLINDFLGCSWIFNGFPRMFLGILRVSLDFDGFCAFSKSFPGFPGDFWAPCELSKNIFRHLRSMFSIFILDGFGVLLVLVGNKRGGPFVLVMLGDVDL